MENPLPNVREIDGSDAGGQFVRSALSLSALSGDPVRITGVRGARSDSGLKPQHLAAVRALTKITDATVEGADVGSESLTFDPGPTRPGEYAVEIGTAGSVTLVFDAALPLAAGVGGQVSLTVTGGTDVKWSPTMDYYRRVKLPLLHASGVFAAVDVDRRGFYPAGGGRATLQFAPSTPSLSLSESGDVTGSRVYSTAASSLDDAAVARRQAETATERLERAGVDVTETVVRSVEADCPGSALVVALDYETGTAGFDALGERGKPAESVAEEAATEALDHIDGTAPVDAHLADQVAPLLALGEGKVHTPEMTDHLESLLDLLATFGYDVRKRAASDGVVLSAES